MILQYVKYYKFFGEDGTFLMSCGRYNLSDRLMSQLVFFGNLSNLRVVQGIENKGAKPYQTWFLDKSEFITVYFRDRNVHAPNFLDAHNPILYNIKKQ